MYHSVSKDSQGIQDHYCVPFEQFKKQIQFLIDRGVHFVAFGDRSKTGVALTFDDAYPDNLYLAAPFLYEKKIPFHVFAISSHVKKSNSKSLNVNGLRMLNNFDNCTIGGHGRTHRPLATLSLKEASEELLDSKQELEDILGSEVVSMSFPHGSYNEELLKKCQDYGYKICGTSRPLPNKLFIDDFVFHRFPVLIYDNPSTVFDKSVGKWDWMDRWI